MLPHTLIVVLPPVFPAAPGAPWLVRDSSDIRYNVDQYIFDSTDVVYVVSPIVRDSDGTTYAPI